jgi:hypothetical protein
MRDGESAGRREQGVYFRACALELERDGMKTETEEERSVRSLILGGKDFERNK